MSSQRPYQRKHDELHKKSVWDYLPNSPSHDDIFLFYDRHTIYTLYIFYLFTKGMVAGSGVLFLVRVSFCRKTLEVNARDCQIMSILASVPWCLRGAFAVLLSLAKHKIPVSVLGKIEPVMISFATIVAMISLFCLGVLQYSHVGAGLLMGVVTTCICLMDVIFNGVYSELVSKGHERYQISLSEEEPATNYANNLIFSSTTLMQLGGVFAAAFVGPIAENFSPRIIFFICMILVSTNLIAVYNGWMQAVNICKLPTKNATEYVTFSKFRYVSFCTAFFAITSSVFNIVFENVFLNASITFCTFLFLVYFNYVSFSGDPNTDKDLKTILLNKSHNKCKDFYAVVSSVIVLQSMLFINIVGAEAFFFTARENCTEDMPRFSYVDYSTTGAIVAAVSGWFGIILYRKYFSLFNIRKCFTLTLWLHLFARSLRVLLPAGLFNSAKYTTWSFFIIVYCILGSITSYMFNIPSLVYTPVIIEEELSTVGFATVVSLQSYAKVVAIQLGLLSIDAARLQKNYSCDYCNLWVMQVIAHVVVCLLCIPIFYTYLPSFYI